MVGGHDPGGGQDRTLIAFPDHPGAEGTATAEEYRDGTIRLQVTLVDNPPGDGFREVWLIRGDASAMVSLGILEGEIGTFTVPAGIDLADYSLVDISAEPLDGDPLHEGGGRRGLTGPCGGRPTRASA